MSSDLAYANGDFDIDVVLVDPADKKGQNAIIVFDLQTPNGMVWLN
jgi:hypothetical protein